MSTHISVPPQMLLERILTLEIVRVTERAAVSGARGGGPRPAPAALIARDCTGRGPPAPPRGRGRSSSV